jgi:peptidoglycan/LPS O-acetylase OafA/YrhL
MFEPANQRERIKALDVLRALAVCLVLLQHSEVLQTRVEGGWTGVDLFFVLSGFLISGLLFTGFKKSGQIRVGRFLVRRGFKIYPPFYVLMAWTVLMFLLHHGHLRERALLSELFFLQSYIGGMWGHTWSLAVEEHFYLFLPLLLILLCRIGRQRQDPFRVLPWMFLAVAFGSLAVRLFLCSAGPRPDDIIRYPSHLNVDSLLFGVVLSYVYHFRPEIFALAARVPRWLLFSTSLALIAPCFFADLSQSVFI